MSESIIIVSGLPRSGTSMMMKMLEACGIGVITDNIRKADEDNPKGYYEFEDVKKIKEDVSWLRGSQGKAVKMVSMLLYELPAHYNYKVIFMRRGIGEIISSQRKMLERKGEKNIPADEEMERLYEKHLREIEAWLEKQSNIKVLYLLYRDVLDSPQKNAENIIQFLGEPLEIEKMVQAVDKSLYRNKNVQRSLPEMGTNSESSTESGENDRIEAQLKALGYM